MTIFDTYSIVLHRTTQFDAIKPDNNMHSEEKALLEVEISLEISGQETGIDVTIGFLGEGNITTDNLGSTVRVISGLSDSWDGDLCDFDVKYNCTAGYKGKLRPFLRLVSTHTSSEYRGTVTKNIKELFTDIFEIKIDADANAQEYLITDPTLIRDFDWTLQDIIDSIIAKYRATNN